MSYPWPAYQKSIIPEDQNYLHAQNLGIILQKLEFMVKDLEERMEK